VGHLVAVFREVRRVLAEDGTLWLNLGDCWATGAGKVNDCPGGGEQGERWAGRKGRGVRHCGKHAEGKLASAGMGTLTQPNRMPIRGLKPKDLLGIPWRVAFALQADGWWLRSEVVWNKVNGMPESVHDRPTKAHEQVFLLSKAERYFYDADAIAERAVRGSAGSRFDAGKTAEHQLGRASHAPRAERATRNRRSVWTIATEPYGGAHFATMPPTLASLCIRAGSAPGDVVLDPFSGAGTTGLAALQEGRNFVGVEANADYCRLARARWDAEGRQVVALPAGERPAPPEQASLLELSEAQPR